MPEAFISIVVPTYRRPARLADCLRSLAQLEYPRDRFEVVVVDDGSGAPPEEAVAALGRHVQASLLVVEYAGPAAARNAGAGRAKGELLTFTDDDCTPTAGWLRAFADRFQSRDGLMLAGHTVNSLPANVYAAASQLLVDYLYERYNADPADGRFFTSNNLAVPADAFREIGGFDTSFPRLVRREDALHGQPQDPGRRAGRPRAGAPRRRHAGRAHRQLAPGADPDEGEDRRRHALPAGVQLHRATGHGHLHLGRASERRDGLRGGSRCGRLWRVLHRHLPVLRSNVYIVETQPTLEVKLLTPSEGATLSGIVTIAAESTGGEPATYTFTVDGATVASGPGTSTPWDTRTVANGGHVVAVTVTDTAGRSASSSVRVTVDNPVVVPPAAPTSLTARTLGGGQATLSWRDNAGNETGYVVERSTASGPFTEVARLGANATRHTDTGLVRQQTYTYRVKAFNAGGDSAYSNTASVQGR